MYVSKSQCNAYFKIEKCTNNFCHPIVLTPYVLDKTYTLILLFPSEIGWHENVETGQKYLVLETHTLIHDESQQMCAKHGAMLPEPRSRTENEFLKTLTSADLFLLGMNDRKEEGSWVWDSDGTPVVFTDWETGEPNNLGVEHCGVMIYGRWFDMRCGDHPGLMTYTRVLICQQKRTYLCISLTFTYLSLLISIRKCLFVCLIIFFSSILKLVWIPVVRCPLYY